MQRFGLTAVVVTGFQRSTSGATPNKTAAASARSVPPTSKRSVAYWNLSVNDKPSTIAVALKGRSRQ